MNYCIDEIRLVPVILGIDFLILLNFSRYRSATYADEHDFYLHPNYLERID